MEGGIERESEGYHSNGERGRKRTERNFKKKVIGLW